MDRTGQRRTKQSKAFTNVAGILLQSSNKEQSSGQVSRVMENRLSLKYQQQKEAEPGGPRNDRKRNKACALHSTLSAFSFLHKDHVEESLLFFFSSLSSRKIHSFKSTTPSILLILHIPVTSDPTGTI